ncbi:MAG TPA: hypothetical protein VF950_27350 [Planctomycetota bacterium]
MSPRHEERSICKACKKAVDWDNIVRLDREIQPRVFERAYVCPHCRAVLEFGSWQTGISRKD